MKIVSSCGAVIVTCAVLQVEAKPLDVAQQLDAMERHYEVLLATADREGTPERPIPYSWRDGHVHFVEPENWCSGFFAGTLWKLYEATGKTVWKDAAIRHTEKLERLRHFNEHHDVGFMLMTSYGNAWRQTGDVRYAEVLRDGAKALASRYRVKAGLIQSWGLWSFEWHCPVIIDNMMNLELLEWASDHPADDDYTAGSVFDEIARAHADATDRNHFRADGSAYHLLDYDPATGTVLRRFAGQGYDSERGVWSRGQAWAVNGFAMMYRETHDPRYLARAVQSADWVISAPEVPADRIAYWDYLAPGRPEAPRDAAGAAVLASGLVELSNFVSDTKRSACLAEAKAILESLSANDYFAAVDEMGGFAIKHCVGSYPANSQIDIPMNYADYYYLEALLRYRVALRRPKVIFDADVTGGADDVAALGVLHALSDRGECEILGAIASSGVPLAVCVLETVNSYYGRVMLPVGRLPGKPGEKPADASHKDVVSRSLNTIVHRKGDTAPDAVQTYRRLLAGQADGTVTICAVGSCESLRALLASKPDGYSALNGRDLVARKVVRLVVPTNAGEISDSSSVLANWPTDVSDFPVEAKGKTLRNVTRGHRACSPVRDFIGADAAYSDAKARTALFAVRQVAEPNARLTVDQLLCRRPRK